MGKNERPIRLGKIAWHEVTRNHWSADLGEGVTIDVTRDRSWKRYHAEKPWRVELFGSPHNGLPWQATLDDAMYLAEREAINRLGRIAARLGMVHPPFVVKAPNKRGVVKR